MSIQTELTRIINAKAAIKTAVEGKGVTVPDGTLLDGMASLIESIEGGFNFLNAAEVVSGTITPTSRTRLADYGNISVTFSSTKPNKRGGCFLIYDTTIDDSKSYESTNTRFSTMSNEDLIAAFCTWGVNSSFGSNGAMCYKYGSSFFPDSNLYASNPSAQVINFYVGTNSDVCINSGRTYAWVAFVINATKY